MTRKTIAALAAAATAVLALPAGAQAKHGFDPAAVRQLCASAHDLGSWGRPPGPGWGSFYGGGDWTSTTSIIDSYPGWALAEPTSEIAVHVVVRRSGFWNLSAHDDGANPDDDMFILKGSCARGTMKLLAADTDLAEVVNAPRGEYLLVEDSRSTAQHVMYFYMGLESHG